MSRRLPLYLAALCALPASQMVNAAEQAEGFIEGSSLTVLNRNFYFNRDHRDGPAPTYGKPGDSGYASTA